MAKHRIHSIEFKRQIAQDFIAGETLHALAGRHDISRNLIRIWVRKFEAGAFDDDARAADLLQDYEAKIAALERMVGRQALEIEFLKGADADYEKAAHLAALVAPYRHARLSAIKLAGDPNNPMPFTDYASLDKLREEIMQELGYLVSAGLIDLKALPVLDGEIANWPHPASINRGANGK